jgi:hypothetical protein
MIERIANITGIIASILSIAMFWTWLRNQDDRDDE